MLKKLANDVWEAEAPSDKQASFFWMIVIPSAEVLSCFVFLLLLDYSSLKQRIATTARRLEAEDGGPPVDTLLLAQPLIDIERASGEERAGPLLANLCFNQRV